MLATAAIVDVVARAIERHRLTNVVLDTVMIAKGGAPLLDDDAVEVMRTRLLPLAAVIAEYSRGGAAHRPQISSVATMRDAARALIAAGAPRSSKAATSTGPPSTCSRRTTVVELSAERVSTRHTHGTDVRSRRPSPRLALGSLRAAVEGANRT
jgi:hydroxymethylpyrimidine/phosphomethylpyrimidine kinase